MPRINYSSFGLLICAIFSVSSQAAGVPTDPNEWVKLYDLVPFIQWNPNGWDKEIGGANVVKVGDLWYGYYTGRDNEITVGIGVKIGLATSSDGLSWNKINNGNPVIEFSGKVTDVDFGVNEVAIGRNPDGTLVKFNDRWVVIYGNYDGTDSALQWATSVDGITWDQRDNLGIDRAPGSGDPLEVYASSLVRDTDGTWYLFYFGGGDTRTISVASGSDPTALTPYANNPILEPDIGSWDKAMVDRPCVIQDPERGQWLMFYSGRNGYPTDNGIGLATSNDLLNWTKVSRIANHGVTGSTDSTSIWLHGCTRQVVGSQTIWRLYYDGYGDNSTLAQWPTGYSAYYGGHIIQAVNAGLLDTSAPSSVSDVNATASGTNSVYLSWAVATDLESGILRYNIYRDSNSNPATSANAVYEDNGLGENTQYQYRISAVNGAGIEGTKSDPVIVVTNADTTAPTMTSVVANAADKVSVFFSEPLESSSASNPANYIIIPATTIDSVQLSNDQRSVAIHLQNPLQVGLTYSLSIESVKDQAKVGNTVAPGTMASFEYVSDLFVDNSVPSNYQWDILDNGKAVYIDRGYTFENLPNEYLNLNYLQTANDDKSKQDSNLIHFTVNQDVTVIVGYDSRGSGSLPQWLQSWMDTGVTLSSTDTGGLHLYSKAFPGGYISLGSNGNAQSMYSVIVTNQKDNSGNYNGNNNTPNDSPQTNGGGSFNPFFLVLLFFLPRIGMYFSAGEKSREFVCPSFQRFLTLEVLDKSLLGFIKYSPEDQ